MCFHALLLSVEQDGTPTPWKTNKALSDTRHSHFIIVVFANPQSYLTVFEPKLHLPPLLAGNSTTCIQHLHQLEKHRTNVPQ